jgi:hypothetical protein
MLAYLTNAEGSIIIAIVFLSLAIAVIILSLRTRHQRRAGGVQGEPTLLERIEAMTNEEYDVWRADRQRQREAALRARRERRSRQGDPGR